MTPFWDMETAGNVPQNPIFGSTRKGSPVRRNAVGSNGCAIKAPSRSNSTYPAPRSPGAYTAAELELRINLRLDAAGALMEPRKIPVFARWLLVARYKKWIPSGRNPEI